MGLGKEGCRFGGTLRPSLEFVAAVRTRRGRNRRRGGAAPSGRRDVQRLEAICTYRARHVGSPGDRQVGTQALANLLERPHVRPGDRVAVTFTGWGTTAAVYSYRNYEVTRR
jgi:hypothetical protein